MFEFNLMKLIKVPLSTIKRKKYCTSYTYRIANILCRTCTTQSTNKCNANFLVNLTGCPEKEAAAVIKKRILDEENVYNSFNYLTEKGMTKLEIGRHLNVLITHPQTLENHYMILEEIGFGNKVLTCYTLENFYSLVNSTIGRLKRIRAIDSETNVRQNCLQHIGLPADLEVPRVNEEHSAISVHRNVLSKLLKLKMIETWNDEIPLHHRLNYKSLRYISRTFDLLTKDIGIPKERVLNYTSILCASPQNLKGILEHVPYLAGEETRKVIKLWPKIVFNSYSSLIKINEYLKEFNISTEAMLKTPSVFTLRPENVYSRLKELQTNPELNVWLYHPQVLRIVLYQRKALKRLSKFQKNNMKCISIFTLQCKDTLIVNRFEGLDKSLGNDVVCLITKLLSIKATEVRQKLKRHPHWLYVPLSNIKETLDYLLESSFTTKEILPNLILLLYPKNLVKEELEKIHTMEGLECCKVDNKLRRDTILPLVLYNIEQPFHFSSESIWSFNKDSVTDNQQQLH